MKKKGSCLCKNVKFEVQLKNKDITVCHCSMCRIWGGGPSLAVEIKELRVEDETYLNWYSSSEWAERGFCKTCGSSLFYRLKEGSGDFMNVSTASLEDDTDLSLSSHVFVDSKPDYYDFSDNCPRLTEKEVLEQFNE